MYLYLMLCLICRQWTYTDSPNNSVSPPDIFEESYTGSAEPNQRLYEEKMDVSSLSDSELRAALIAAGASVGPITGTTRRIFENKLRRLQNPKEDGEVPVAQQPVEAPPKEIPADVKPPDNQNNELPEPKSYFGVAIPPNDSSPQTGI